MYTHLWQYGDDNMKQCIGFVIYVLILIAVIYYLVKENEDTSSYRKLFEKRKEAQNEPKHTGGMRLWRYQGRQ